MKSVPWLNLIKTSEYVLIIHHWDSDGISSAALISQYIHKFNKNIQIDYVIPEIGTYRILPLNNFPKGNLNIPKKNYDITFILDYSVPETDIIEYAEKYGNTIVYDHHLRSPIEHKSVQYYNPVASGEPGFQWPSCTWVIKEYLDLNVNNLVIMGVAGDLENRFLSAGFGRFPELALFLENDPKRYKVFVEAKQRIDAQYKIKDITELKTIVQKLILNQADVDLIMVNTKWARNMKSVDEQIAKEMLAEPMLKLENKLEVYNINSAFNIISDLTRKLASTGRAKFYMVINNCLLDKKVQIYVRRDNTEDDLDTDLFRNEAFSLGAQVGGKTEVAGIIMEPILLEQYLSGVKQKLGFKND